ncbi:MAG: hypothetical protein V2A70_05195 [Candidatus Omnitrophota bacterium]
MLRDEKPFTILAYSFILCIIPLIYRKNDAFIQFHARQGLALFLCEMAVFIVSIVFPLLFRPALFIFAIFSFWGMIQSLRGERTPLPFIHTLSQKLDI